MLPNLIIIGAPKAATTSLHGYLKQHPEVGMSAAKELSYFWRDDWRERQAWYEAQFDFEDPRVRVRGESTPFYAAYPFRKHVPERMHELVPDAKLVYVVRDPIDRLVSHWVQRAGDGDRKPFARYLDELDDPENRIVCPSRYWLQLTQFLEYFDPSQLLVVDQHELRANRSETLREVFRFIGVDESFESPRFERELNTREEKFGPRPLGAKLWDGVLRPAGRLVPDGLRARLRAPATKLLYRQIETPVVPAAARERLIALFGPEVEALRGFTGKRFESWSL